MTHCWLSDVPNWIQAIATVGIAGLTLLTLIVLNGYAKDTKRIANSSVDQIENSQMPFLALIRTPEKDWLVANQGYGAAINVCFRAYGGDTPKLELPPIAAGAFSDKYAAFGNAAGAKREMRLDYESLSGRKYATRITWHADGDVRTEFVKDPKPVE